MSAYGSGTGPESLDEPLWDEPLNTDSLTWPYADLTWPYTVTTASGTTGHTDYDEASRLADSFAARGIAVALTVAGDAIWSFEPGREGE